jgi:hypothetical protein
MGKDEPATLPRVSRLVVISRLSPWCTIITRETGVTIADVCSTIFKEYALHRNQFFNSQVPITFSFFQHPSYTEHDVSEAEFGKLNQRSQDQLRRSAAANLQASQPQTQPWGYYTPAAQPERLRRVGMSILPFFLYPKYLISFDVFFFADWLRERVYFEGLSRDDGYARQRLGYRAPNVFIMDLIS